MNIYVPIQINGDEINVLEASRTMEEAYLSIYRVIPQEIYTITDIEQEIDEDGCFLSEGNQYYIRKTELN